MRCVATSPVRVSESWHVVVCTGPIPSAAARTQLQTGAPPDMQPVWAAFIQEPQACGGGVGGCVCTSA